MRWLTSVAVLVGAALIAASILFIGRWQISAIGYGYKGDTPSDDDTQAVYRLDRWTGEIDYCVTGYPKDAPTVGDFYKQYYQTGKILVLSITCVKTK